MRSITYCVKMRGDYSIQSDYDPYDTSEIEKIGLRLRIKRSEHGDFLTRFIVDGDEVELFTELCPEILAHPEDCPWKITQVDINPLIISIEFRSIEDPGRNGCVLLQNFEDTTFALQVSALDQEYTGATTYEIWNSKASGISIIETGANGDQRQLELAKTYETDDSGEPLIDVRIKEMIW